MKFTQLLATASLAAIVAFPQQALALLPGTPLPALEVSDEGEMQLRGEDIHYTTWRTDTHKGKLQVLQCIAGRKSASTLNKPFTDKLRDRGFPLDKMQVTTVVNIDDAMAFTSGFVLESLKEKKQENPRSGFVVDSDGKGAKLWALQPQSSAIIIVSATGEILYFKDGALTPSEIEQVLTLIAEEL